MSRHKAATPELRQVAPGVHVAEARQRFYGLEIGARMTVLELEAGLLVHSPVALDPSALEPLGEPRWVLAPNLLHHLYVGPWLDAGLEGWAARGLPDKRPDLRFHGVVEAGVQPFGREVELIALSCFPATNEVVVLHRPSRTLIVTDLLLNISPRAPGFTRLAMRCLGGYPGCRTTVVERLGMDRPLARREIARIAALDFDRLIMAHGEIVEHGARQALVDAFRWLSLPREALATRSDS